MSLGHETMHSRQYLFGKNTLSIYSSWIFELTILLYYSKNEVNLQNNIHNSFMNIIWFSNDTNHFIYHQMTKKTIFKEII